MLSTLRRKENLRVWQESSNMPLVFVRFFLHVLTRRETAVFLSLRKQALEPYSVWSVQPKIFNFPSTKLHFWEIDKIGYTRVVSEQNRVPFFSRRGAHTHVCKTPPKRVLTPEPTTPCVRAAPQTVFSVFDPSKQRQ